MGSDRLIAAADSLPPGEPSGPRIGEGSSAGPLRGMTLAEMRSWLERLGEPPYRARQLYEGIYRRAVRSMEEMTNLPLALRRRLAAESRLGGVALLRAQGPPSGTRKLLFGLADGRLIEGVLMRDEGKGRTSLCVSSQVGCAVGCTFCLTGYGGFQRHCSADEIVDQVLTVRRELLGPDESLHGVVFMGMGEPMLNLGAVIPALRLLSDPDGVGLSPRRMTVSTAGIVPGIEAFGRAGTGANLAVSLNATTDAVRDALMPLNRRWPIGELIEACRRLPLKPRQRITIEYVLLRGVNDSPEDARRLVRLLRPLRCKVNLIMFNPHELLDYGPVPEATLDGFCRTLAEARYTVSVRWSKGREIEAACGQLAAHYFEPRAAPVS